jgi:hypothetical protein
MRITRVIALLVALAAMGGVITSTAAAKPAKPVNAAKHVKAHKQHKHAKTVKAADAEDEVVLPSRVANAITRGQNLLEAVGTSIDSGDTAKAIAQLSRISNAVARVNKAAVAQMNAAPADPEAETTPGPDAVVAALAFEQGAITTLTGYFDSKTGTLVDSITHALFATMNTRDKLANSVLALDPEGAGAGFADGMADTVAGYDDEVANITEAIANDTLSAGAKKVLNSALKQSQAVDAKMTAAFGGGE